MIKKLLILSLIFINITQCSFASESIISSLVINNTEEREIELVTDKNTVYVPCKYILNFFKISFKENHATKSLSFKNAIISTSGITIDGKKTSNKVFFIKNGISGIQNEFFISSEVLSLLTGENIKSDNKQLQAYITTKDFKEKEEKSSLSFENPFLITKTEIKPKAFENITLPIQKGLISLDKISLSENRYSDSYSQIYKETTSKMSAFNNNLQLLLSGKIKTGEYTVGFGTNSYTNNPFGFSGLNFKYKNQFKNYDYILGKTEAWDFAKNNLSSDIIGIQIKNHISYDDINYKHIEGKVAKTSTVIVHLNDDYQKEISTYGGYFNLENINYDKPVQKIKLEELNSDSTTKTILEKTYPKYTNEYTEPTPNKDFILGINGLQNRLWANDGYIYQTNTQKALIGFKHNKKLSDKLTLENFITADNIINHSANSAWSQSILGNKKYLNYTTIQNQNSLSGATLMGALTYNQNEKFNSKLTYGTSFTTSTDNFTTSGLGGLVELDEIYKLNKDDTIKLSLFGTSPAFYVAGYSGANGFMSDKVGGSINISKTYKQYSLNGTYSNYKSNFANYYDGGLMDFNEYNINLRANFKKLPTLNLHVNSKKGGNDIGQITSTSYDFIAEKHIKYIDMNGGLRANSYTNDYSASGYSSYKSDYSDIFTELRFPLGKRFGYLTLGHDIVNIKTDTSNNNYNSLNFKYLSPQIKSLTFNFSTGFHYTGTNRGNDYGFGITKRLKSGSCISLNYRFNQIPFYMVDNMYIPGSVRHSITLDFTELYGIGSKGIEAIGIGNENKGFIEISSFLDVNQNGKQDKGEPYIENVPFKISSESNPIYTEKNGKTKLKTQEKGIYNIKDYEEELPTLISCCETTKPSRYIKIESGAKSKIKFGFISTVGNISGTVTIKDEFNNPLRVNDIIVSLLDLNGKEVNYTNLNDDGTFSFSGLAPGQYKVEIDKELQNTYKINPDKLSTDYTVTIPAEYKNYVNIDNVNLNYKYAI